jgi:hypothetical protein
VKVLRGSLTPHQQLKAIIEEFNNRLRLQEEVLAVYERQLAENPDNIRLRELVVQAYFWNGRRSLAIDQYQDVIINAMYQSFNAFDEEHRPVLELLDRLYLLRGFLVRAQNASQMRSSLQKTLEELDRALEDLRSIPSEESARINQQSETIDKLRQDLATQEAELRIWAEKIEESEVQQQNLEVIRNAILDKDSQDSERFVYSDLLHGLGNGMNPAPEENCRKSVSEEIHWQLLSWVIWRRWKRGLKPLVLWSPVKVTKP